MCGAHTVHFNTGRIYSSMVVEPRGCILFEAARLGASTLLGLVVVYEILASVTPTTTINTRRFLLLRQSRRAAEVSVQLICYLANKYISNTIVVHRDRQTLRLSVDGIGFCIDTACVQDSSQLPHPCDPSTTLVLIDNVLFCEPELLRHLVRSDFRVFGTHSRCTQLPNKVVLAKTLGYVHHECAKGPGLLISCSLRGAIRIGSILGNDEKDRPFAAQYKTGGFKILPDLALGLAALDLPVLVVLAIEAFLCAANEIDTEMHESALVRWNSARLVKESAPDHVK